jgi:hypothetical protein
MPFASPRALRAALVAVVAAAALTAPALADLGTARRFAILSPGGALVLGSYDAIVKVANPSAATCPAGIGCTFLIGAPAFSKGQHDKITAPFTKLVAGAGRYASMYAQFLASQRATNSMAPIVLKPGATLDVQTRPGLNVFATPAILLGNANPQSSNPCGKSTGDPATLVLEGGAADTIVFNIGSASKPGALVLCGRSRIVLSGGITPDRVTFNVGGKGNVVSMGGGGRIDGGILAPMQGFAAADGVPGTPPTMVNGSILVGGAVTIGNNAVVTFYPTQNVGVPATLKIVGKVNINDLPTPPQRKRTIESENNPPQPILDVPYRPNLRKLIGSGVMPAANGALKGSIRRPNLSQVKNFAGLSQNGKTPSDVQFAAGTSRLLEMVNVTGAFYTNPGGTLIRTFDLGQFFLGNQGQGTDPRVYYDAATGNFIAAYEMHPAGGDDIRLAIASNPGDSWTVYDVANNNTGATFDQPKLGVSSNKIIISWNNYGTQSGTSYIVIQKAGVVARSGSVPAWIWTDDNSRFQIVPANQYTADQGTHYATWHCCGRSNVDLMAFTGVPGVSPVNFTENAYGIGSVTGPPAGHQPAGGDPTINTNDDRSLSAIWQNGNLWTNFNEGCRPQNDRAQRACERYVELGTPNVGVRQNVQLQWTGNDIYYSSVVMDQGVDGRANLFFGVTFSSATQDPAAMVLEVPGASFTASTPAIIELAGVNSFAACTPPPPPNPNFPCPRWGDYTAAARDPRDPTKVWIVNQYGGLSNQFWGTSVTEVGN